MSDPITNLDAAERLSRFLAVLHPCVHQLRQQGWPAEASVETLGGKMVVWVRCDMHDVRVPEEAVDESKYGDWRDSPTGGPFE